MRRRPAALALIAGLAACQPLPHPFATEHDLPEGRLMTLPDVVGIAVDPVQGTAPANAAALRVALVKALQDDDIPATAAEAGEHAYHVTGMVTAAAAEAGVTRVAMTWTVADAAGTVIGRDDGGFVTDTPGWRAGTPDLAAAMRVAAGEIADTLHLPGAAPPPPPKPVPPPLRLAFDPVTGAPGDGDTSLPRALAYVLQDSGVQILDAPAPGVARVGARITVTPAAGGQQKIRIVWTVRGADGASIGTVAQENDIPKGSLDGAWSDAAGAVAAAAGDAVRGLVVQAMQPGHIGQ